jgi:hypothetical protein
MGDNVATAEPFVRAPVAGSTLNVLGTNRIYKATAAETGGSFSLWDMINDGNIVSEARYQGEAPTGAAVDFPIVTFLTFREGLLAGERFYYDLGGLLTRLHVTGARTDCFRRDPSQ